MSDEKTGNIYLLHKFLAVFLDIIVIVAFVFIGEKNHDRSVSVENIVRVALPFIAAYFPILIIFAKDLRNIKTAAISSAIAVPIAVILRIQNDTAKFPFIIVAWIFLTFFFVAWRFLLGKLRPATPTES